MSSYIGKEPAYGVFSKQAETGDGSTTAYTLNYTTADATQLLVSVGGVLQEPRIAYTINAAGNTLTFTEAPASTSSIWILWLGRQLTGPRVTADSITAQSALGTSPSAADTFLMYDDNVGDLKKVAYSDLESDTANMAANTVKVRDAATTGVPSNKTVTDTQILIGDGTGFTAAALSGDVTMTNAGVTAIGTDKVVSAMILADNITTAKIAASAVSTTELNALAVTNAKVATGIDAVKLADGTVTNAELQYINTLSSNAQTQLDAKPVLTAAQEWTAQQNFNNTALSFDATQDWALTANQVTTLTLTANTIFDAPTQMVDGAFYSMILIQDGTGGRTASWPTATFKWAGGTAPTLTTTAAAKDLLVFRSDGTLMYEVGRQLNLS